LLSWARAPDNAAPGENNSVTLSRVFWQGALTNVLNPKVALFFLAFLPQFVDAEAQHKALAFLALGLIFIFNGTLWCVSVAIVAARASGRVKKSGRTMDFVNRGLGALFVYLGARIALAHAK
jgi:threonine/homoserine/homoserine lactone efflux protein